jgi:hypothetical protein
VSRFKNYEEIRPLAFAAATVITKQDATPKYAPKSEKNHISFEFCLLTMVYIPAALVSSHSNGPEVESGLFTRFRPPFSSSTSFQNCLAQSGKEVFMSNIEKVILGALGGLSAVLVKFLGQDYPTLAAHAADLTANQILNYKVGYVILTPILMFLGAFVAWISEEQKRMKLVAIAVAAPAMITTWSGGTKSELTAYFDLTKSAYAQPVDGSKGSPKADASDATGEESPWQQIKGGVGNFFGYGKEPKKYWVIVGSFNDRADAQRYADRINQEDSTLNAWVGVKVPPNDYYPVIVGGYSYLSEARALKERAMATKIVKDVYLSEGAKR